jgi:DNA polymerase-3 subunit delta
MIRVLTGENSYAIEQELATAIAAFQGEVEKVDGSELTLEKLPDLFMGVTLFATERLIVLRNVSQNRAVWSDLADWLERAGGTELILIEDKPDKRTKTYKWLQKHAEVREYVLLQQYQAEQWVERTYTLDRSLAKFIVEYVGTDQWRLVNEMKKVQLSGQKPSEALLRKLVEPTPQATSFEVLDAAFAGNREALENSLATVVRTEDPYMFFGLLASQVYAIALMHSAETEGVEHIARQTGLHPFVLKKVSSLARRLRHKQLVRLSEQLAELDMHLKSRPIEPWQQIRSMLLSLHI